MQFQSHYNRFLLSLEGTKNIYVSFCENIISFCGLYEWEDGSHFLHDTYKLLHFANFNSKLQQILFSSFKKVYLCALNL